MTFGDLYAPIHCIQPISRCYPRNCRVNNVRVFGSVLHGNDTDDSDLDLLVDPTNETTLMDIAKIQLEVAKLLNVTVDVLTPKALPDKFRDHVIQEAKSI